MKTYRQIMVPFTRGLFVQIGRVCGWTDDRRNLCTACAEAIPIDEVKMDPKEARHGKP